MACMWPHCFVTTCKKNHAIRCILRKIVHVWSLKWSLTPATIGPLANERAVSMTSRCDVAHSGRENLHQFLPILLWRHVLSSSIMTLCFQPSLHCKYKAIKLHVKFLKSKKLKYVKNKMANVEIEISCLYFIANDFKLFKYAILTAL